MPSPQPYLVPAGQHRHRETIQRSRFITTLARAESGEVARGVINSIRAEFPDASHHCWAFVAGPPRSTAHVGLSDDGEPHGTAGRPMLNVLLHTDVGEVVAVCTRYYGGVKLGTGGLSRAYAGGVTKALEGLATEPRVEWITMACTVPYDCVDTLNHIVASNSARIIDITYGEAAQFVIQVAAHTEGTFRNVVRNATQGRVIPSRHARP